jgi:hypothetical protein
LKRWGTQLHPVRGVTASKLFDEAARHAPSWDYLRWASALRDRALLIVTADDQNRRDMDALAAALRQNGSSTLQHAAVETDHSFSDRRIALQTIVLAWLESLTNDARGAKR